MEKNEEVLPLVDELQQAIKQSGLSLNQLGKQAGVSQAQLSRFVRGERTLTLPAVAKLCVFLGLRLAKANRLDSETGITYSQPPPGAK
ncbi:MAG: helix-turn-helix transcriptional regulator [Planctomycetes bacterium]|nr:helix-turn-helix transcriptional regulator [Planctomycetota bacterium]